MEIFGLLLLIIFGGIFLLFFGALFKILGEVADFAFDGCSSGCGCLFFIFIMCFLGLAMLF